MKNKLLVSAMSLVSVLCTFIKSHVVAWNDEVLDVVCGTPVVPIQPEQTIGDYLLEGLPYIIVLFLVLVILIYILKIIKISVSVIQLSKLRWKKK